MKILRLFLLTPLFTFAALAADNSVPVALPTPPAPAKAPAPVVQADPAVVDSVLKALHFDELMGKALDQQKQMVQQMIARASMPGTAADEIAAFRKNAMDTAFIGLSPEEIHAVAARNYGETFTTDELRAIADFYNSPAGQAYATKRPQAEQKIGTALRPRVMEAMKKIQQLTRDFVAKQQAKATEDAAKAAAAKAKDQKTAGPTPTPTPATSALPVPSPTPLPKS
ncbi:MAG TPA: DUF2059 domain-containing protein [Opitutaceae bacterium]|jgi:hypothetical protein|nr:DUF2059 domain-containing protein [Opitutaceae bacterium]